MFEDLAFHLAIKQISLNIKFIDIKAIFISICIVDISVLSKLNMASLRFIFLFVNVSLQSKSKHFISINHAIKEWYDILNLISIKFVKIRFMQNRMKYWLQTLFCLY